MATVPGWADTFVPTGLSPNSTYTYRIQASNSLGNSLYSSNINLTTVAAAPQSYYALWISPIKTLKPHYNDTTTINVAGTATMADSWELAFLLNASGSGTNSSLGLSSTLGNFAAAAGGAGYYGNSFGFVINADPDAGYNDTAGTPDSPCDQDDQSGNISWVQLQANEVNEGQPTQLSGSVTDSDPDATNVTFVIKWDDNSDDTSIGPVALTTDDAGDSTASFSTTHTYPDETTGEDEGAYNIQVTASDDDGNSAPDYTTAAVDDAPISVSVGGPSGATEGQLLAGVVVGQVTDANLQATAADFSGTIDWGDGPGGDDGTSTSAASFQAVDNQPGVFNILGTHTYKEEGGYDMVIQVSDDGGASNGTGDSNMFNVADAPISLFGEVQINGTEGSSTGLVTVATLTDQNPNPPASDFANNVWINWGDGGSSQATLSLQEDGSFLVQGSHTYAEEGIYNIKVSAQDAGGSIAVPVLVGADIQDAPISLSPNSVGETELLPTGDILAAVLYDSNLANTDVTDFNGTATYGDNTAPVNVSFSSIGGGSFLVTAPTHTYPDEGIYTMQVDVQDVGQAPPASCQTTIAVAEGAMGVSLASNIIQGSTDGTQFLVPLTITTHVEPNAAWALGISDAGSHEVDVWSTPTPGPNDTPVLGLVGGSIVDSITWNPGVPVPATLYVGAYHGSSTIGDIQFFLGEGDSKTEGSSASSPTATAVYFQVQSLAFGGGGEQSINKNNGTGVYGPTTQWNDGNLNGQIDGTANLGGTIDNGNEYQYPISYVRSTPNAWDVMQVTLTVAGTIAAGTEVEGVTDYQGISFSPHQVVASDINATNNTTTFTLTADTALPNTIDSSDMNITWEYSVGGSPDYANGQTTNHLYVTGAAAPGAYETVLWLGCNAAKGLEPAAPSEPNPGAMETDQQVIRAVWGVFATRNVIRVDGTTMRYDHSGATTFVATGPFGMLAQGQGLGQCTAWADLLVQVLACEGEVATVLNIQSIPGTIGNPNSRFTVKLMPAQGSGDNNYTVGTGPAPGNYFRFHQVVYVSQDPGRIYDPSYGTYADGGNIETEAAAEADWEDESLVSFMNADGVWEDNTPDIDLSWQ